SNTLRFHDKTFNFVAKQLLTLSGSCFREFGYHRANARSHFDPTFLDQLLNDLLPGVRMNFESGGETSARRKCLAWLVLATQKGLARSEHHLIENGMSRSQNHTKQCHTTIVAHVSLVSSDPVPQYLRRTGVGVKLRGEVWAVDFEPQTHRPESGKKQRPALIIQCSALSKAQHPTTIVIPGTSQVDSLSPE